MSSSDIMCNGHRYVKSTLFQCPNYLADLSPYITAVISSRLLATPIQITANAIKPLAPIAHSILPTIATSFILSGTLTCEYCLHQVRQDSFDDGRKCPSILLEKLSITESDFVLADQLIEAQEKIHVMNESERMRKLNEQLQDYEQQSQNQASSSTNTTSTSSVSGETQAESSHEASSSQPTTTSSNNSCEKTRLSTTRKPKEESTDEAHLYKDDLLIMQICPEIGLHAQAFACVDCDKEIDLNSSRLCHYDGRYYCYSCHSGSDLLPIPARVLRNWDFTPKPVSKTSLQKICFLRTKPILFNLFQLNPMLYGFIDRLVQIKQTRERIQSMLKYLEVCGQPNRPYLVPVPKHFLISDLLNFFTLNDLYDINLVYDLLAKLQLTLETHIVSKCESCRGKGYYCELCKDPRDVLYPFSKNGAVCTKCHTVYHKICFHRKKKNCPKCVRISVKRTSLPTIESNISLDALAETTTDKET